MPRPLRVILAIESSRAYGRGCLRGIGAYVRSHNPWQILHLERNSSEGLPDFVKRWKGDGVIARVENRTMARGVARLRLPVVDLRGAYPPSRGIMLDTDPQACAGVAADHFLERGFRHFAFCGYGGVNFSDQRCAHFQRYLAARGYQVAVFRQPGRRPAAGDTRRREATGELAKPQIALWLAQLPRPAAVFACNDVRGRQVLAGCALAGLAVPDEIAVLGVDNDEVICDLSTPPLSSIQPDTFRLGYEGASLLDGMMSGKPSAGAAILVPPKGVAVRRSSDVSAVDDAEVSAAMALIRAHACDGITVEKLVRTLTISRATLERRFLRAFGRTPKAEIERVRFELAKLLLAETAYKLQRIAAMTGLKTAAQFATAFKRHTGLTPGQYRMQGRPQPASRASP